MAFAILRPEVVGETGARHGSCGWPSVVVLVVGVVEVVLVAVVVEVAALGDVWSPVDVASGVVV